MKAMLLESIQEITGSEQPLILRDIPIPKPGEGEVLIRVTACGVCHTELDEIEGRTPPPSLPIVPGHQVVGSIERCGKNANRLREGDRVGVAWIYAACGKCNYCLSGQENLCAQFKATGRDTNGGYAQFIVAKEDFVYPIPALFSNEQAAPLLCAGAIGYRSLRLTNLADGQSLGLVGFGASAHIVLKLARMRYPNSPVFVFSRSETEQSFARELGADWSGFIEDSAPTPLYAIIDTTPAWKPILDSLIKLHPGGRLVINAIRKEDHDKQVLTTMNFPLHLWMEKEIKSVANVSRADVSEFLEIASQIPILPEFQEFPLEDANKALLELKQRKIRGAKVLKLDQSAY